MKVIKYFNQYLFENMAPSDDDFSGDKSSISNDEKMFFDVLNAAFKDDWRFIRDVVRKTDFNFAIVREEDGIRHEILKFCLDHGKEKSLKEVLR
jgi:hypothetical protein